MRHGVLLLGVVAAMAAAPAFAAYDAPGAHALSVVGTTYHRGGSSPEIGFDCSGLVAYAFLQAWGLELPRRAQEQRRVGKPVKLKDLQAGDLVFYNTRNKPYSHVGIYVGDGRFVHAPRSGARVRVESVHSRYWRARYNGARRVAPPG